LAFPLDTPDVYYACNEKLSHHTITDIKFKRFRARYPRLHGYNAMRGYHGFGGEVTVAQIFTDSGASGWGPLMRGCGKELADNIMGNRVSDIFASETGVIDASYAAFDIALHDLAGNILGIPVRSMLNPDAVSDIRVYDGAIYMNDLIPEDKPFGYQKVIDESLYDYGLGHRTFKIKIGRGNKWMEPEAGLQRDIEITRGIHEALPDAVLMVDGNDGFTPETMKRYLDGIGGCRLYWIEEPFPENEGGNRQLRNYLDSHMPSVYIADGESHTDIPLLSDLAAKGLLDIWQPDICGYGFTAWRALIKFLVSKGYLASPHAWGEVIKTHYCAHLAAAYPLNIPYTESVLGESEGVDYSGYTLKNGILSLPDKPGFGMDLIWAPEVDIF
jgi:L-alanine-DL-glutamate epimerase-like enolase superfamily enzyme